MDNPLQSLLPEDFYAAFNGDIDTLTEIVADLGRNLEYRTLNFKPVYTDIIVQETDIQYILARLPKKIPKDGRLGIPHTLNRISVVWDKNREVIGFTIRIGRIYEGSANLIKDLITEGNSILIIGSPGAGKSTCLRHVAKICGELKRTIVIDKSNEIGGESNPPTPAIGLARRFQVAHRKDQSDVMLFALESHTPECIIVDEIGNEAEVEAARTIGQRGVQLIATAHGKRLQDIIKNPTLKSLLGDIKAVTVGDRRAESEGTGKIVLEREQDPTFQVVVEIISFDEVCVYTDIELAIDTILQDGTVRPERRRLIGDNMVIIETHKVFLTHHIPVEPEQPKARFRQPALKPRTSRSRKQ